MLNLLILHTLFKRGCALFNFFEQHTTNKVFTFAMLFESAPHQNSAPFKISILKPFLPQHNQQNTTQFFPSLSLNRAFAFK